jgi:putative ABC transport system ATP-binding protein
MAPLIEYDRVRVEANGVAILDDISFGVEKGEAVMLYGRSGAGKTTILNTLLGVMAPTAGEVRFAGEPVSPQTIARVRAAVSYVAQDPALGAPSVRAALELPFTYRANRHLRPSPGALEAALAAVDLEPDILERETNVVSGGERQRLVIARELLLRKQVFLVDEASAGLDGPSKSSVMRLFREGGFTLLSISHDRDWLQLGQRFVQIDRGRVAGIGLRPDPRILEAM